MVDICAAEGLSVRASFESEFILFQPTEESEYRPAGTEGMFTVAGLDRHYSLCQLIIEDLQAMGVAVEQLGKEYGPGQYEATTQYDGAMKAADDFCTLKEVVRAGARDAGLVASFMPKPYADMPGCGLHVHLSLWDAAGITSKEEALARGIEFLPRSLPEALQALEADQVVTDALGSTVRSEFLKVKRSELEAYDLHVHPWERTMYLEAI
jgi:glutamine synthetase